MGTVVSTIRSSHDIYCHHGSNCTAFTIKFHTLNLFLHHLAMEYSQQGMVPRTDSYGHQDAEPLAVIVEQVIVLLALPDSGR